MATCLSDQNLENNNLTKMKKLHRIIIGKCLLNGCMLALDKTKQIFYFGIICAALLHVTTSS